MAEDIPVYLLKIVENGRVLAQAQLIVDPEDEDRAWDIFQDAFGNMSLIAIGSLYQTMRTACGKSPVPAGTPEVVGLGVTLTPDRITDKVLTSV